MSKAKAQNSSGLHGSSPDNPILIYRPPVIDTTKRRKVIKGLTNALYAFLTIELDEMELAAAQPPMPMPRYATPEMLVQATEHANSLREQLENAKVAVDKMPDGVREVMRAGVVLLLEGQLLQADESVSRIQADLES